jgi:hypothetical protein
LLEHPTIRADTAGLSVVLPAHLKALAMLRAIPSRGRSNNGASVRKAKDDDGGNPNPASDAGGGSD